MRTALLVLGLLAVLPRVGGAGPQTHSPALGLYHVDAGDNPSGTVQVSVNGSGFGAAQAGTFALANCGTAAGGAFAVVYSGLVPVFTARSTVATEVSAWTDRQIVVKLTSSIGAMGTLSVRICTASGSSTNAAITKWTYEHVDVPPSAGTNPAPLAVARETGGNVWLNEEFHNQVKRYSPVTTLFTAFNPPQVSGPGIFAWDGPFGDIRTPTSIGGEDIIVDPLGRVWLSETGSAPYEGVHPNHSRIIMYDPTIGNVRTLNIPGDRNGVFGLSWDALRNRIWFTESRRSMRIDIFTEAVAKKARVTSFDPLCVGAVWCNPANPNYGVPNWQGNFSFDADAATWICQGGSTSPPVVGTCEKIGGSNNGQKCFTNHDCVMSHLVCPPGGGYDYWCFHEYEIPDTAGGVLLPAHVLAHSDGTVWYSAYWGGDHLGRLDPAAGTFQQYPLPDPVDQSTCNYGACDCFFDTPNPPCPFRCCSYLLLGSGPWSVVEESSRDVALSFQNQPAVGRFDFSRANDPACLALDGQGQNPCLSLSFVPVFDPDAQFPHSTALDGSGNAWLSLSNGLDTDCTSLTSVGYKQVSTGRLLMFPPLSFYPKTVGGSCIGFSGAGMAFDPSTGGMWIADFFRKRLVRIRPQ